MHIHFHPSSQPHFSSAAAPKRPFYETISRHRIHFSQDTTTFVLSDEGLKVNLENKTFPVAFWMFRCPSALNIYRSVAASNNSKLTDSIIDKEEIKHPKLRHLYKEFSQRSSQIWHRFISVLHREIRSFLHREQKDQAQDETIPPIVQLITSVSVFQVTHCFLLSWWFPSADIIYLTEQHHPLPPPAEEPPPPSSPDSAPSSSSTTSVSLTSCRVEVTKTLLPVWTICRQKHLSPLHFSSLLIKYSEDFPADSVLQRLTRWTHDKDTRPLKITSQNSSTRVPSWTWSVSIPTNTIMLLRKQLNLWVNLHQDTHKRPSSPPRATLLINPITALNHEDLRQCISVPNQHFTGAQVGSTCSLPAGLRPFNVGTTQQRWVNQRFSKRRLDAHFYDLFLSNVGRETVVWINTTFL